MKLPLVLASVVAMAAGSLRGAPPPVPLRLEKEIPLPGIVGAFNHHAADGRHHRVFLCASTNKSVEVVDLVTGRVLRSLPGEKPSATCFAPDLNLLCVSRGATIQVYEAGSFALLGTIPMPSGIDELRYDPTNKRLYAGCMTAPTTGIAAIDLAARKVLFETASSQPQGFCLEDDGARIFISTPKLDQVTVIDRQTREVVAAWTLGQTKWDYPTAYDAATHRLFVGCRRPARLLIFNTDTGRQVSAVETARDTDDLAFDPATKRIYVACGEGAISVIQQDSPDRYRNIATIPTAPGGRNSVFVPETGEFCVSIPQDAGRSASLLVYRTEER